eukprot:TRINITY_DN5088_c0_g1_i5.p1 TRINITY_DN5088_c0_g1~~TRINITY_DN5088_c0_g1_i5.p1  ORF type:complete len:304 (+),score=71.70 TRINITY_DN5088_c0_g1_i5:704-1615(+)
MGMHIPFIINKKLTGTARYASLNTHLGYEQSRRDDLESLGYTLIYLLKGYLPWQNISAYNRKERYNKIKQYKMELSLAAICKKLPNEIVEYMQYCRTLKFEEKPNYQALRKSFRKYFDVKKWNVGFHFDWVSTEQSESEHKPQPRRADFVTLEANCAPLHVNATEKEERKSLLKVPNTGAKANWSFSGSNVAEKDPREDDVSETCNLKTSEIKENGNYILSLVEIIPDERPILSSMKVPEFKSKKFNQLNFAKKYTVQMHPRAEIVQKSRSIFPYYCINPFICLNGVMDGKYLILNQLEEFIR